MPRPLRVGELLSPHDALAPWLGRVPFVLYFYPQDETPGCIVEACGYRDHWSDFEALGVPVVGVSRDDDASHAAFAQKRRLPFTLLSDRDGSLTERLGATMLGGLPRRISYLVSKDGRVAAVFDSQLRPGSHSERMLAAARALTGP